MVRCFHSIVGFIMLFVVVFPATAQGISFFRIGTGATSGTYFVIGGLLANAVSNPPGSRACDAGGSCGVPGLIAVAQSTAGSLENINLLHKGMLESALVQADLAYFAFDREGPFAAADVGSGLRSIAYLYPDTIHLVALKDSPIQALKDIRGRVISMGELASGTSASAQLVIDNAGMSDATKQPKPIFLKPGHASDALIRKEIDAFFLVGGYPLTAVADLSRRAAIQLIPIPKPVSFALQNQYSFYHQHTIPALTYHNVPEVETLQVGAVWLVSADMAPEIVYGITRALWHPTTHRLLSSGHKQGLTISPQHALKDLPVPLHPGAERFYRLNGLVEDHPIAP